jgi:ADP-ribose pyrophosphatase
VSPLEPEREARRRIYRGRVIDLNVDTLRLPDGTVMEREYVAHAGAAAILPFVDAPGAPDPRVLLLRQYRHATGGELWEVPAGTRDAPEEPWADCAHRELEEETGFRARSLRQLTRIFTAPGFCDEIIHLFMAWDLEPGHRNLDDDEFVEVVEMRFSEALEMVRDGRIVDAKSVATLLWVDRFAAER